jgi:N-acetylglucosamine-6-phosphate deacetylase
MQISGRDYRTGEPTTLTLCGGLVAERSALRERDKASDLPWIAPGFVDLQSNGYGGQEFSSPELTVNHVEAITRQHWRFGVTKYLPTVTTAGFETLRHAMQTIARAVDSSSAVAETVAGIHLEGPYISKQDGARGAHPLEHCRAPDWQEFEQLQNAASGRIKLVTLSPEYPSSVEFIRRAVGSGVVVAIGHTSSGSAQIQEAVDAGASLSTHLGNGAHSMLPRHPNYLWDQLAEDRLMASLIVDGHHLPPEVVKVFVRSKSPQRLVLISDLSGMAGQPAGRYRTSLCELEILPDGRLVVAGQDRLLAGAARPIGVGVALAIQFADLSLKAAVNMATLQPATIIHCRAGGLEISDPADLVLFHFGAANRPQGEPIKVVATVLNGDLVYQADA